ncbi:DUF1521 domain-containing protein [Paraburkholderia fungorum]|uniref:DUF1521 domain-containing protein n=1 Tax=Paraburkholderia fungorum TaxID=134537 RepID=A0A3R7EQL7_9BURK|nr:DUF1521 domain-containing protein [Paraburkholderia fungorum]RKF39086.1 hypothetical protein BCY88_33550 [Paraburkholderia fungorum]
MQAATQFNLPQISNPYLSLQGNVNTLFGGGAQSQLARGAGTASQMSNMLSGFSKASFSVFSQTTTANGQTNTFIAQGSVSNRGQSANQQPTNSGHNDGRGGNSGPTGGNSTTAGGNRCNDNSRADNRAPSLPSRNDCGNKDSGKSNPTPPRNDCGNKDSGKSNPTPPRNDCGNKDSGKSNPMPPRNDCGNKDAGKGNQPPSRNDCGGKSNQTQWTNTAVCNDKASINLGNYTLDFNKADSSMVMTNTKSGDTTKIWGDPHLTQHENAANSSTAMFNGPMTFMLPDDTKVTVSTQAAANNKNVSFADQVTITHGNQAYQVTGLSEQNKSGLNIQKSNNGRALDAATPDGYTVLAARNGSGWIDPVTGKQPTADNIQKANT